VLAGEDAVTKEDINWKETAKRLDTEVRRLYARDKILTGALEAIRGGIDDPIMMAGISLVEANKARPAAEPRAAPATAEDQYCGYCGISAAQFAAGEDCPLRISLPIFCASLKPGDGQS
jgi:hypothetical protein